MVCPGTPDSEVKRQTGFPSEARLLAYVFILYNGDIKIIQERRSSLTWYEEWYSYFQFGWGRTLSRWIDLEKEYGLCSKVMRSIFRHKLFIARYAHSQWTMYVTCVEDLMLRRSKWNMIYRERYDVKVRPGVMWDMTCIKVYQFGAAELQRGIYSEYYAGTASRVEYSANSLRGWEHMIYGEAE